MDPWNEVSTDGGRNMRATCVRVLAAALLTGAIASVVGLSAFAGPTAGPEEPLAAPPSALERTIRLHLLAERPQLARRAVVRTVPRLPAAAPAQLRPQLVIIHTKHVRPPLRRLAVKRGEPEAVPVPVVTMATAGPVDATAPVASSEPEAKSDANEHGRAKARGHEKHAE